MVSPQPFLVTKLARPAITRWHLPRPHLTELLSEGLTRRLTTLIAPAGHGKTSTLAHFLAGTSIPCLWIQLDPSDCDCNSFALYLARGIRDELGGGNRTFRSLEEGGRLPDLLPLLVADLNDVPGESAVILDDFHLVDRESSTVQLLEGLVRYGGPRSHLFVCSRTPLPFSIARLKVTQEAGEIGEEELRLTPGEILIFLKEMAGVTMDESQLRQVYHLTEGWSAALVLLASSLRRRGNLKSFLEGGLPPDVFDYLADEVIRSLNPDLQRFMEETSILDACSPQTCEAVLEHTESGAAVAQILNSNLLLTQLGHDSFRYHHLLQRFLQERLKQRDGGVTFRQLHRQAGDWQLSRGMAEEAVRYYLRGEWLDEAARLLEQLTPLWVRTNRLERLWSLMAHLPPDLKERHPWIALCEARHALSAADFDTAMGLIRRALSSFQERGDARGIVQAQTTIGEIAQAQQDYHTADGAFAAAVAALRPEYRLEQAYLLHRCAVMKLLEQGPAGAAEADLRHALSIFIELGDLPGEAAAADTLGVLRAQMGDFATASQLLERSVEITQSLGEQPYEVGLNLAWVYHQAGRFQDAIKICEPMVASSSRKWRRAYAAEYLLYIYTRLGDFPRGAAMAQTANAILEELPSGETMATLKADLAGLYRLSGQPQAAVQYANAAVQLSLQTERANFHVRPVLEAVLLHLFHSGNAAAAARMAEKALARISRGEAHPYERMMLNLTAAVAEFRQARTESRPEGVRILHEALSECSRRGYEFFALHEWPLALTIAIYGLAYRVQTPVCLELIRRMNEHLPEPILREGIPLWEAEARLVPAAWQAIADESCRELFSGLLTPADRRRVMGLVRGPAPLHIQSLGPLTVTVGNEPLDARALRKRKSGLLLILLLVQDGPVPRDQVIDQLWPDLDAEASDTSLRVSLHHLRRLLEPHLGGRSRSRYIQSEGGLVWFSRESEVQVDLDQFRAQLTEAEAAQSRGDRAAAAACYEAACKVYRGDLGADDPYSDALEEARRHLREQYTSALDWLGEYYWREAQDHPRAILAYKRRLTEDMACEPAHQALMRIYLENGQVASARMQYAVCREALAALGAAPARVTDSLLQLAISIESESPAADAERPPERSAKESDRPRRRRSGT